MSIVFYLIFAIFFVCYVEQLQEYTSDITRSIKSLQLRCIKQIEMAAVNGQKKFECLNFNVSFDFFNLWKCINFSSKKL